MRLVAEGWDLEHIQGEPPLIDAEDVQQALLHAAEFAEVTTLRPMTWLTLHRVGRSGSA